MAQTQTKAPGSLLTFIECNNHPCDHSSMVYKEKKLCENSETCPFMKKSIRRQQKAQKPA